MKTTLTVRVLLLIGLVQAGAALCSAEIYKCLTWEGNARTVVDIDGENRARCSGSAQARVATISADPYESVEMDQDMGTLATTFLVAHSDWNTYISQTYSYRYKGGYNFLYYLSSSLSCDWACPTPYQAIDTVVPDFDWPTHGGLPYTYSGNFSGSFYFY